MIIIKKVLFILISLTIIPFVNAKETPSGLISFDEDKTGYYFFANGTPITIDNATSSDMGAKISWDGGSIEVPKNTNVYGGYHNNSIKTTSSITINGGTIYWIYGGGLHKSHTTVSKVVLNDGYVKDIRPGGSAADVKDYHDGIKYEFPSENTSKENMETIVEEAYLTINGGVVKGTVFGGGMGISYVKNAYLTINNGDLSSSYVTAGGSNGVTSNAVVNINGGNINIFQASNKGVVEKSFTKVTNGNIDKLYIAAEDEGDILYSGVLITGGKINTLSKGKIKNKDVPTLNNNTSFNTLYLDGTVINDETHEAFKVIKDKNITGGYINLDLLLPNNIAKVKVTTFPYKSYKLDTILENKRSTLNNFTLTDKETLVSAKFILDNPNTSDNIVLSVIVFTLSSFSLITLLYFLTKEKSN